MGKGGAATSKGGFGGEGGTTGQTSYGDTGDATCSLLLTSSSHFVSVAKLEALQTGLRADIRLD